MMDPKKFYRDFDHLLNRITKKKPDKNFLCSILDEFVANFGQDLHIQTWRIYEKRGLEYVLINPVTSSEVEKSFNKISINSEAVQFVEKNGSYIYDDQHVSIDPNLHNQQHYAIPAAVTLKSPEKQWIVVFELKEGWSREEVLFAFNAIRTALNYRLYSEAIQTELEQAAQIQKSLLPGEPPDIPGYQIAARYQPTEIVGGDLYDFSEFDNEMFGICIGDASGHGIPAALLVRDVVIGLRMGLAKNMKMVHTMLKLNSVIHRSTYSSRFVSLFYGEVEQDGHLIYVNAGHPAPFLVHGNDVLDLKATGLILGALPEIQLHRSFAQMKPQSVLLLYTDGMFERENLSEEAFSINRLKQVVIDNQKKSAQEILDIIFEEVYRFGNRQTWEDDSTVVVIKRLAE